MANSSRRQIEVKPREDSSADYDGAIDGNPGDFDSDHGLANIQSDVINGEQVRHKIQDAHDLDNEGDVLHAEKSKHSILKSKFKKKGKDSTATVVRLALDNDEEDDDEGEDEDEEEDNENHQQNEDDDGNNTSGRGIKKYAGKKRGETSKMLQSLAKKGNGSSKAMQQGSNSGTQGVTTRRRGRPSKAQAVLGGNATSTVSSSAPARLQAKRKRAAMEAGRDVVGIRRSSRPAAESAAQQISEQSKKRPKAVAPTTPLVPKRKVEATLSSSRKGKGFATKAEFEVELILDSRQNKKTRTAEYLVKWKGYHVKDNTWEPVENLTHCDKALRQFRSAESGK